MADPHLLPPDAKPSGGADRPLRWKGWSLGVRVLHEKKPFEKEGNESKKKRQQQQQQQTKRTATHATLKWIAWV